MSRPTPPMTTKRRIAAYRAQNRGGPITARQQRRIIHKEGHQLAKEATR